MFYLVCFEHDFVDPSMTSFEVLLYCLMDFTGRFLFISKIKFTFSYYSSLLFNHLKKTSFLFPDNISYQQQETKCMMHVSVVLQCRIKSTAIKLNALLFFPSSFLSRQTQKTSNKIFLVLHNSVDFLPQMIWYQHTHKICQLTHNDCRCK